MTLSDILARADEPVWTTNRDISNGLNPMTLRKIIKLAWPGDLLCQSVEGYPGAVIRCVVTQELIDAVEARDE